MCLILSLYASFVAISNYIRNIKKKFNRRNDIICINIAVYTQNIVMCLPHGAIIRYENLIIINLMPNYCAMKQNCFWISHFSHNLFTSNFPMPLLVGFICADRTIYYLWKLIKENDLKKISFVRKALIMESIMSGIE
jgi:hypothetical protein